MRCRGRQAFVPAKLMSTHPSLLPIGRVIGLVSVVYAVLIVIAVAISWKFGNRSQTVWGIVPIDVEIGGAALLALSR